jgi:hypothetical protein
VVQATKVRYSTVLEDLKGFDEWLQRLGVPVQQADRAHRAIRIPEKAERAFQDQQEDSAVSISKTEYLFSLTEALELHDVYVAYRNQPADQLRQRLIRALNGPALPEHETQSNRDGRNIMFELALGAEWSQCGAEVDLVEPDLFVKTPDANYFVACKRPDYEHGIRAAVHDAASQLRDVLSNDQAENFGVIAISLSRVLNRGRDFFSGTHQQLNTLLQLMMEKHLHTWKTADFHPRNIAVLLHAHTPADWGDGLFRMSTSVVAPTTRDRAIPDRFKKSIDHLYSGEYKKRDKTDCEQDRRNTQGPSRSVQGTSGMAQIRSAD